MIFIYHIFFKRGRRLGTIMGLQAGTTALGLPILYEGYPLYNPVNINANGDWMALKGPLPCTGHPHPPSLCSQLWFGVITSLWQGLVIVSSCHIIGVLTSHSSLLLGAVTVRKRTFYYLVHTRPSASNLQAMQVQSLFVDQGVLETKSSSSFH